MSTTYEEPPLNALRRLGYDGRTLAQAEEWGSLVVAAVDLDRPANR